jgi:hypothetical protein
MQRKGVTLALLRGLSRCASGRVSLQLVLRALRRLQEPIATDDAAEHGGGEKVFVDFASDAIDVVDPTTAEVRP